LEVKHSPSPLRNVRPSRCCNRSLLLRIPLKFVPAYLHAYVRKHKKRLGRHRVQGAVRVETEMVDAQARGVVDELDTGDHSNFSASELKRSARHNLL
jgi:hypothetical protein